MKSLQNLACILQRQPYDIRATRIHLAQSYCGCKYWISILVHMDRCHMVVDNCKKNGLTWYFYIWAVWGCSLLFHDSASVNSLALIFCFAGLRDSYFRRTPLCGKPVESVFLFSIILMQQSSVWHLSASVSVSVLLNFLQEPDCDSDLMSVLMGLPRSSRPGGAENLSPKSVWPVLTGPWPPT